MKRFRTFIGLGVVTVACASAGSLGTQTIEVGQINGSGQNLGLTDAYISGATPCIGGGSCVDTSGQPTLNTTGFAEADYDASLFFGASLTSPQPFTGYNQTTATPPGTTMTDPASSIPFAMISDGLVGGNDINDWMSVSPSSITIPVGVFGVEQVWTMLDDKWGSPGSDVTVTFNFSSTSNGSSGLTPVTVALTNGQQIRGATDCGTSNSNCSGYTQALGAATTIDGVGVSAENIFSTPYSFASTGHGKYNSSVGNLVLDDQDFDFSTSELSSYLVDIVVSDSSGATNVNQAALSAISLVAVATPEPASFLLIGAGLTALGLLWRKRVS